MHGRVRSITVLATAAVLAAVAFVPLASAQGRLSLSERVARLEQQAQGQGANQSTVELLNRINELQAEVQNLRGLVEQQNFEIEQLKNRARDQYTDLDARLTRLEGGAPPAGLDPNAGTGPSPTELPPAGPGVEPEPAGTAPVPAPIDRVETPTGTEASTGPVAAGGDEKAAYDDAFAALRDGRYAESARRFASFVETYPDGEFADNAHYWLGESYYVTQNYRIALETFSNLLRRFPESPKAPDALLKIGYCHYELREWAEAERALNDVVQRYPDTTVARLAQGRLRALRLEPR
jgi:tol-pal system protein YbgF